MLLGPRLIVGGAERAFNLCKEVEVMVYALRSCDLGFLEVGGLTALARTCCALLMALVAR